MFDYLKFDDGGKKIVAAMDGKNKDMLMDITVFRLKPGETLNFFEKDKESALLLTQGAILYRWEGQEKEARRKDVFSQPPSCLHTAKGVGIEIAALEESEIIFQATDNEREFPSKYYDREDLKVELMGDSQWEGTARREVVTVFDYYNAPDSNMVIGEVITRAGRWSSYIPHSHPQPEVYYYKFERPKGFGAAFIGDDVFKVADGSAASIPGGLTHPQAAAPGYNMYYCWMIRHLDNNPWTTRDNDKDHIWLLEEEPDKNTANK